ncbi:PqiC family protein [Desulfobotulus mexicanus]|uniref:Membrane integrity-associated transporter subunit PqiC n=1 Tax=Desulfobotulus mexicanus TaxID=2586642 RepID=A0A5S5MCT5_9BACT|nr:PqiC family protein [Desulfobotulus mexicanus]TYT73538.1 membrane integrity-associated transporter subunit PqiC [Desulfobotulus mexicanus]
MRVKKAALFKKINISDFLCNKVCGFPTPLYLILFALLISGCTATPQPRVYHLGISTPPLIEKNEKTEILVIETTNLPRHLDRPQLITRSSENEIIIHEQERWAAALDRLFRESLAARLDAALPDFRVIPVDISGAYGGANQRIRIQILDFSSDINGNVRLLGTFGIIRKSAVEREEAFEVQVMAEDSSKGAVIAAHDIAMGILTRKIIKMIHP